MMAYFALGELGVSRQPGQDWGSDNDTGALALALESLDQSIRIKV
jgi:hypothetical protein